jgi:hypothetical protein
MKVLDLQCAQGHSFEGWFGSQGDYDAQRAQGLVTCPVCNDSEILKKLSAPRLNLGHGTCGDKPNGPSEAAASPLAEPTGAALGQPLSQPSSELTQVPEALQQWQTALLEQVRHVMANTEDVGSQFAEEARKIHYGERAERNIRGQATREETEALLDEGIAVMALPLPDKLKGPLQ